MSYRYVEVMFPEIDHIRYRPSGGQLIAALNCLVDLGWCLATPTDEMYVSTATAKEALRAVPDGVVLPHLQGYRATSLAEWPQDQPMFTPDLCEDVRIISSPVLLGLPVDCMTGGQFMRSQCQEDIRPRLVDEQDARAYGEHVPDVYEFVRHGFFLAPDSCPLCATSLSHQEMVLETPDFEIEAPFCHVAIVLTALHTPTVAASAVYLEPKFLDGLSAAVGVPVRSMGHWS